ncbi:MAG TPA: hypothetical protein VL098_12580 [Flavipsychrobacter sp.]|nr:hypothetical protein [Flavipsychrobacter sp.]
MASEKTPLTREQVLESFESMCIVDEAAESLDKLYKIVVECIDPDFFDADLQIGLITINKISENLHHLAKLRKERGRK